mgnify:CR=1 FL=1
MTEDVPEEEVTNDGLVFHEGMRLTDMKIRQNLSVEYPRLEPLHHLKIEFSLCFEDTVDAAVHPARKYPQFLASTGYIHPIQPQPSTKKSSFRR